MNNSFGFRKKLILWLSVLTFSLLLTGCLKRSEGGANTRLGMSALEKGDYSAALAYFDQASAAMEDPVVLYRGRGIALMGQARYDEAAQAFETALSAADSRMPKTIRDIRLYQVSNWYRMGEYENVINEARELLDEERSAELYFLLGASFLARDDQDSARENFDQAAAMSSGDYGMYLRIYECYEQHKLTGIGDI